MSKDIFLTNNLTNKKEKFVPIDKNNIRMYVCGPTVYDDPHIGNARPIVIFDILYKIFKKRNWFYIFNCCIGYKWLNGNFSNNARYIAIRW